MEAWEDGHGDLPLVELDLCLLAITIIILIIYTYFSVVHVIIIPLLDFMSAT